MWYWGWHSERGWNFGGIGQRMRRNRGFNWGMLIMLGIFITVLVASGGRMWWLFWAFPFWFFGPGAWKWMQPDHAEQPIQDDKRKHDAFYEDEDTLDEKPKRAPQYVNTPDGEVFEVVDAPPDNKPLFKGDQ